MAKIEINSHCSVLVIGSNSFTGGHFIKHLLDTTRAQVTGVSRSPEYSPVFLPYHGRGAGTGRFRFEQIDVNRGFNQLADLCDTIRPQVVVNYAAQGEVRNSWKWPEQLPRSCATCRVSQDQKVSQEICRRFNSRGVRYYG